MINFGYQRGILKFNYHYYGKPALCCFANKGDNLSPDKLASRMIDFSRKYIGSKYVYFYGSDPFLFADHELGVLFHRLQMEGFYIIAESSVEVSSSLYSVVDYLIQLGTMEDLLKNYVSFKNCIVILYDKEQESLLNPSNVRRLRGSLPEIFLRPSKAYQYKKVAELICKIKSLYLSENPFIVKG